MTSRKAFWTKVLGILFAFFLLGFMMGRCSGRRVERRHAAREAAKVEKTSVQEEIQQTQASIQETLDLQPQENDVQEETDPGEIQYVQTNFYGLPKKFEQHFNDMQDAHLACAEKLGVRPFSSRASVEERTPGMIASGSLVMIQTNERYCVYDLTRSHPYVIPKCARFLDELAERFQKITESKSRFYVSSVLRTDEDIRHLQGKNGNATVNSAHRYGTTIDIAYARYEIDPARPIRTPELRLALAEVLRDMQMEGKCLVKIEKKQYCYHITVK